MALSIFRVEDDESMKNFARIIVVVHSLCLATIAVAEDSNSGKNTPGVSIVKPQRAPAQNVTRPGIERQDLRAQLLPTNYTVISAEIGAKVERYFFREGEAFNKGQTLMAFECNSQKAQLSKARAALSIADKTFKTNKRLLELNSVGRLEYEASEAEYLKSAAEVEVLASQFSKCRIQAPFKGRVVEQRAREEQFVQVGQPLLEILDDSSLELEFIVPSKWMSWLKPDFKFQIKIDETGKQYPAKITRVGARIDTISQSLKVAGVIDGKFPELTAGMSGLLVISSPENSEVKK